MSKFVCGLIVVGVISGCGAAGQDEAKVDVQDNTLSYSTRISTTTVAPGVNGCDNGGILVSSGFDQNENRILDSDEVSATQVICHGENGADGIAGNAGTDGENGLNSLIRLYDELAGDNCANGGIRIVSGVDLNSDEFLSTSEAQDTRYLCNPSAVAGADGEDGRSCTVEDNDDGSATISCDDGTSSVLTSGEDGANGLAGVDGNSCTAVNNDDDSVTISCEDGTSATVESDPGRIITQVDCFGALDGDFTGMYWAYKVTEFANYDINVYAEIRDSHISANASTYWRAADVYDSSAVIFVGFDPYVNSNFGFWELSFDLDFNLVNVTYDDIDLADGTISWVLNADDDCTVYDYATP